MVRPLGKAKDARLRDLWTVLETVAWIASRDIELVSGVSRYQPQCGGVAGLAEGARHNALRMDIEEGFCQCGGSPGWSSNFPPPHCRCPTDAERLLLEACRRGELLDRSPTSDAADRGVWRDAQFLHHGGVVFRGRPDMLPLFSRRDIQFIWKQNRQHRRKEKIGTAVAVDELVNFLRASGDVGRRKALDLAREAFPNRRVTDRAIKEACRSLNPNKTPGRPSTK